MWRKVFDRCEKMAVRYTKLPLEDPEEENILPDLHKDMYQSGIDFGSLFTYAQYNSLNEGQYFSFRGKPKFRCHRSERNLVTTNPGHGTFSRTLVESGAIVLCYFLLLVTVPFSLAFCLKFIRRFERLVVFRIGRVQKPKGPGAVVILPCIDTWQRVDLRTKAFNVPPIQAVTLDGGVVELGATVYYRIKDALAAVVSVQDWNLTTRTLAHTMLHRHINKKRMSDVLSEQRALESELTNELNKSTFSWGMEITEFQFSDIKTIKKGEEPVTSMIKSLANPQASIALFDSLKNCKDFAEFHKTLTQTMSAAAKPSPLKPTDFSSAQNSGSSSVSYDSAAENLSLDVENLVCTLSSLCNETLVADVGYVYHIDCIGSGEFYMDLKNGAGWVEQGPLPVTLAPDISITLNSTDLMQLVLGQMSPWQAYTSGRVKISGDLQAARKLQVLAKTVSQHLSKVGQDTK